MAATPPPSSSSSSINKPSPNPFDYSFDSPPKPSLSSDQLRFCSQALKLLRKKLQIPSTIRNEFTLLEETRLRKLDMMSNCTVALKQINLHKNRYTDVLPFDDNRVVLKSSRGKSDYINASMIKVRDLMRSFLNLLNERTQFYTKKADVTGRIASVTDDKEEEFIS